MSTPKTTTRICIVDGLRVPTKNLSRVAAALEKQVNEHFGVPAPFGWGMRADVRVASKRWPARPDEWQLHLLDVPDMEGALGYHDVTAEGQPIMKVFPSLTPGDSWTITASHEVLETLSDPVLVWCAQDPRGVMWAAEVCDAVENFSYKIDGISVSDFVTPYYFAPPSNAAAAVGKMDYLGLVKQPYEILDGGYGQWFDAGRGWVSVFSRGAPAAKRANRGRRWERWQRHQASEQRRVGFVMAEQLGPSEGMPPGVGMREDGGLEGVGLAEFGR